MAGGWDAEDALYQSAPISRNQNCHFGGWYFLLGRSVGIELGRGGERGWGLRG